MVSTFKEKWMNRLNQSFDRRLGIGEEEHLYWLEGRDKMSEIYPWKCWCGLKGFYKVARQHEYDIRRHLQGCSAQACWDKMVTKDSTGNYVPTKFKTLTHNPPPHGVKDYLPPNVMRQAEQYFQVCVGVDHKDCKFHICCARPRIEVDFDTYDELLGELNVRDKIFPDLLEVGFPKYQRRYQSKVAKEISEVSPLFLDLANLVSEYLTF